MKNSAPKNLFQNENFFENLRTTLIIFKRFFQKESRIKRQKPRTDFNPSVRGFNVNMVFFVSHKILLFTHKPLDTHDKGYRAESYQNLINGLFENPEALDITGVSDFFNLFPLLNTKPTLNDFVLEF